MNRPSLPPSRQSTNVQTLDCNVAETGYQPRAKFVVEVQALVSDFPLCFGHEDSSFLPPMASLPAPG
jgi:hypothetical protein